MKPIIRSATIDDIPAIHALTKELAIFEKAESEFIVSVESYAQSFKEGVFQCLVAEMDGKVVGMVLYYMAYSTWKGKMLYLEDFVVQQDVRGMGIGKLLFQAYLDEARRLGCTLTKWQVLDWNQPAIDFYEKYGSIIEKNWWNCKVFLK